MPLLSLFLAGFSASLSSAVMAQSPLTYGLIDGRDYHATAVRMNWFDAERYCEKHGGHLATFDNTVHYKIVDEHLRGNHFPGSFWLGYHDINKSRRFEGVDGTACSWLVQATDKPTDEDANCVATYRDRRDGDKNGWYDVRCERQLPVLCRLTSDHQPVEVVEIQRDKWSCPPGFSVVGGICYALTASATNWPAAQEECAARGAGLATFESEAQMRWVGAAYLQVVQPADDVWIGLSDVAQYRTFAWADGRPVEYSNWGPSEPRWHGAGLRTCAVMHTWSHEGLRRSRWAWSAVSCGVGSGYQGLCAVPATPVSNPEEANTGAGAGAVCRDGVTSSSTEGITLPADQQMATAEDTTHHQRHGQEDQNNTQKHRQVARMVAWAVLPLVVLGIVYMALTKPHSPAPQRRSRRGRARDRETDGDGEGEGEEEGGGDRAVGDAVADASGAACAASLAAGEGQQMDSPGGTLSFLGGQVSQLVVVSTRMAPAEVSGNRDQLAAQLQGEARRLREQLSRCDQLLASLRDL